MYANLDVAIGHSQVPQLVGLGGYSYYFAWRPQKGLDDVGVPRSFFWRGLSGDEVLVTRHRYGGWNRAVEFSEKGRCDPSCRKIDFDYNVMYT